MKTDKEKMLAGEPYLAFCNELVEDRARAKDVLFEYNNLRPSDMERRTEILKQFLGATGQQCTILDEALVTFGDNVLLAPNVSIYTAGHAVNVTRRIAGWEYACPVAIGHNVWIGGNVVILPGVSIGDNSIIGAGSVVTKNIPANAVAVGNPCKVIRELTEDELK